MNHCCKSPGSSIGEHFDVQIAERELKRYVHKGPNPTTRRLRDQIVSIGTGTTLLDIGAGIGAASFELLAAGYTEAVCIDISPVYAAVTRHEIMKRGLENRVKTIEADFAAISEGVKNADTVVMDRVVCCYPQYHTLLESALQRSRRLFAFSYPHRRWYVRFVFAIQNILRTMRGDEFRTFVHSPREMEQIIVSAGFRKLNQARTLVWSIDVYRRSPGTTAGSS